MMESIRTYLLSVICAAVISAIIVNLVGNNSTYSAMIKLLTGLFLSITVISPLLKIEMNHFSSYFSEVQIDASNAIHDGTMTANDALSEIIKENTEAYILDKAASMGVTLDVAVSLTGDSAPKPQSVIIDGAVSPAVKIRLQEMIENDLDIPREKQLWR